jgi:RNA polymerase sigma-32 factor
MPDLIQEGILGLMKAVTKYDPARGVRLSTYASWWIRAYIYQYTMANARLVRMVTTYPQRKLFFSLRRERSRMEAHGEAAEPQALAERLRVPVSDVVEMDARLNGKDVTLEGASNDLAGAASWGGQERSNAEEALAAWQVQRAVRAKMEALETTLDERERAIIAQRLTADEPMTLGEVGRRFGISRERVRQLESRLKKRLQVHLRDVGGSAYGTAEA